MFGDALANSGSSDFREDDREQYIRTLRDLGLEDLRLLQRSAALYRPGGPFRELDFEESEKPSIARLTGLGLIYEFHRLKDFQVDTPFITSNPQTAERLIHATLDAFKKCFGEAPTTVYQISNFGERFLSFISEDGARPKSPAGTPT
jgi:hypothetical protein